MVLTILLSTVGSLATFSAVKIGNKFLSSVAGFSLVLVLAVGA